MPGARAAIPNQSSGPEPSPGAGAAESPRAPLRRCSGSGQAAGAPGDGGSALLPSWRFPTPWLSPAPFGHPGGSQAPQALGSGARYTPGSRGKGPRASPVPRQGRARHGVLGTAPPPLPRNPRSVPPSPLPAAQRGPPPGQPPPYRSESLSRTRRALSVGGSSAPSRKRLRRARRLKPNLWRMRLTRSVTRRTWLGSSSSQHSAQPGLPGGG